MVNVMIIFTLNMNQSLGSIVIVTIAKSDFIKDHLVTSYLQVALYHHIHFQAVVAVPKPPYFNFLCNFRFTKYPRIRKNYEIWNIFTKKWMRSSIILFRCNFFHQVFLLHIKSLWILFTVRQISLTKTTKYIYIKWY